MSGHSKWSTIKHKKAAADQKRGQIFSKLSKDIAQAVREGKSGDPSQNPRLRLVLTKAREVNMPSDNIKRAIDRALGKESSQTLEQVVYEGYGPTGVAVLTVVETDNRQRTSSELRYHYDRAGGNLGGPGSAMFLFRKTDTAYEANILMPFGEDERKRILDFIEDLRSVAEVVGVYTNADLA